MTTDRRTAFGTRGWRGPETLLTPEAAGRLADAGLRAAKGFMPRGALRQAVAADAFADRPWHKSMHAYVPELFEMVRHPALAEIAVDALGPNVIAWGAMLAVRRPGARHRWHVDIEHVRWPGITVFVGLRGTVRGRSGLRFVDGSHHVPLLPQEAGVSSDEGAVALAREHVPTACLSEPPVGDGELLAFDGLTWHSSENRSDGTRVALLVQYAPAEARICIPLEWDNPIRWHECRPPCVLVAGSDLSSVNRLVSAPLGCLP